MTISLGLPWLLSILLRRAYSSHHLKTFFIAAVCLFIYSVGIEIIQQFTGRQLSGLDMMANAVGVIIGSVTIRLCVIIYRWNTEKSRC